MMKRWIRFAAILSLLAFAAGCPYTTKVPLGSPDRHLFDSRLLGEWTAVDAESDSALIRVYAFNDSEYYIEASEAGEEPDRYRAFPFSLGGGRFLQVNELGRESAAHEYIFARYELSESGELTIRFVGEDCVPTGLAEDTKALRAFIAAHVDDPALDDEGSELVLKKRT